MTKSLVKYFEELTELALVEIVDMFVEFEKCGIVVIVVGDKEQLSKEFHHCGRDLSDWNCKKRSFRERQRRRIVGSCVSPTLTI